MMDTLRRHWPEYLIEAFNLGAFMVSAGVFTVLLEYPGSSLHQALPDPFVRRVLMGLAMGLTAVTLIYSRWGRRSGAHMNPATTLAFFRLGKIGRPDLVFYVAAQFAGGFAGIAVARLLLGGRLADPAVRYVVTVPGRAGPAVAFGAEFLISFLLMGAILRLVSRPRLERAAGLVAGLLVALYITVEAPYSGMSMNPARTFGPALLGMTWTSLWLYFVAPPLGMVAAGELFRRTHPHADHCAKLRHDLSIRCHFCGKGGAGPG